MTTKSGWNFVALSDALKTLASASSGHGINSRAGHTAQLLSEEVREHLKRLSIDQFTPMPGKGLAHDHIELKDTGLLLRIPKQSQLGLNAVGNLSYQAACFARMWPSRHTPRCHAMLMPCADIQMGALLVEHVPGHQPRSTDDFNSIACALASIHRLPLPEPANRAPLYDQLNPMKETLAEVLKQATYLSQAPLNEHSLMLIESEMKTARTEVEQLPVSPVSLVSFDAHPGNFLINVHGEAVLVDLEKGRYGGAGFDLAHATLYTSTTWDIDTRITLSMQAVNEFHATWRREVPKELGKAMQAYLIPKRRLMWLWSVTWCAKWLLESQSGVVKGKHKVRNTEDWAIENNSAALISHVQDRVEHYLHPDIVERMCKELASH